MRIFMGMLCFLPAGLNVGLAYGKLSSGETTFGIVYALCAMMWLIAAGVWLANDD